MATKPVRSIGDVPGLTDALALKATTIALADGLATKLALAGGTLTGAVMGVQAGTSGFIALTNNGSGVLNSNGSIYILNNQTGLGLGITNQSTGYGASISNASTGRGLSMYNSAGGIGLHCTNNSTGIGAAFYNNASGTGVYVNTSNGNGLSVQTSSPDITKYGLYCLDNASTAATIQKIAHYGSGYGQDIANFPGANSAFVIHQYSQNGNAAMWLDNCGTSPIVHMRNTENTTIAPGQLGTGKFFKLERRPSAGAPLEECWYMSGEGVICNVPKALAPVTLADGMVWVEGAGAGMALKVRLNGVTKTVTVS